MWPIILLGLGVIGYFGYEKYKAGSAGGTTSDEITKTANYALQNEHDPNVLKTLALKLDAAGFHDLAAKLSARADELAHSQGLVPANQVFTLGQMGGAGQGSLTTQVTTPVMAAQVPMANIGPGSTGTLGGASWSIQAPRGHVTSGPNGFPLPSQGLPYVSICSPIRR